ncbi:unnamed protein product, partial [Oppiella nova]
ALKLSSLGANVVITGRDDQRIQSVVKKCESLSKQKALGVRADLMVDRDVKNLVEKTIEVFGKIDILVNNAGIGPTATFEQSAYLESYDKVMNTNVRSIQVLTQLVVPYLESTKGNIINISSVLGLIPSARAISYCMAKSALDMFTKCLALELGPRGVRVNSVNPAVIRTPFFETMTGSKDLLSATEKQCQDNYPLRRIGEPEDVSEAVAYLCSPVASFITGAILPVDGGSLRAPISRTSIMNFDGNVALITGSSSGIGEAIALKLSSLGANVVITGRDDQRIRSVVKKCESLTKQKAIGVRADLIVDRDVKNLVEKTVEEFGKIDILVNNAGIGDIVQFGSPGYLKTYDKVMNTNVRSIQVLTQLVVPYLETTKGNIINISSTSGLKPSTIGISYNMAKSALDMFTKCLALELGPKGIRVNSVNPAGIRTPIFETVTGDKDSLTRFEMHCKTDYPLQRIGEPEDVAEAVAYLCSPVASFIT